MYQYQIILQFVKREKEYRNKYLNIFLVLEYERIRRRLKPQEGKQTYYQRMQTVEPVFRSLQQYYGPRWNIRTR